MTKFLNVLKSQRFWVWLLSNVVIYALEEFFGVAVGVPVEVVAWAGGMIALVFSYAVRPPNVASV